MASRATLLIATTGALAALASAACGADSSPPNAPPPSSVPADAGYADLTVDQKAALCDWGVGLLGGYGAVKRCPDGSCAFTVANQAACLSAFPPAIDCSITVAQYEACVQALAKSQLCGPSAIPGECSTLGMGCLTSSPMMEPAACN